MIKQKRILLGVSGGIAAFKAAALTSKLVQAGAEVRVIMTESAKQFVTPLTFQALSRQPVYDHTFTEPNPEKIAHIELADWADLVLIAPATANVIGKLANGIADDMLTTTLLATLAPIYVAPAMNVNMYHHPAVKRNIDTLKQSGYRFLDSGEGYLACGWTGKGRMAEPDDLLASLNQHFIVSASSSLTDRRVLITAGPTREQIDPVRYYSNYSSGKMGYALAAEAKERGADVVLVTGPTDLTPPAGVSVIRVISAEEMYEAVIKEYDKADLVVKAAAVADYRPKKHFQEKMKKQSGEWQIEMVRTKDILKELGERKQRQILVALLPRRIEWSNTPVKSWKRSSSI